MIKLTDAQLDALASAANGVGCAPAAVFRRKSWEARLSLYHQMINESMTHRIVEAPEGYKFENKSSPAASLSPGIGCASSVKYNFWVAPIPAPCPPPKLDPVMALMEVEARYPLGYKLPTGWEIVYQTVGWLKENGFTHCLLINDFEPASTVATIEEGNFSSDMWPTIGLKKWEGI